MRVYNSKTGKIEEQDTTIESIAKTVRQNNASASLPSKKPTINKGAYSSATSPTTNYKTKVAPVLSTTVATKSLPTKTYTPKTAPVLNTTGESNNKTSASSLTQIASALNTQTKGVRQFGEDFIKHPVVFKTGAVLGVYVLVGNDLVATVVDNTGATLVL